MVLRFFKCLLFLACCSPVVGVGCGCVEGAFLLCYGTATGVRNYRTRRQRQERVAQAKARVAEV